MVKEKSKKEPKIEPVEAKPVHYWWMDSTSTSANGKWIEMHPYLRAFRFTVAWTGAIALYVVSAIVALIYGVMFSPPAFTELLLAWLAGLGFTWIVIEPGEVGMLVLFPQLAENERLMACREKCKELGIYG